MDLFGVGPLEMLMVLIVAILVVGPAKMVEAATKLGKFWREAQKLLVQAADAATASRSSLPPEGSQSIPAPHTNDNDSACSSKSNQDPPNGAF